jgi:hypothetical protein
MGKLQISIKTSGSWDVFTLANKQDASLEEFEQKISDGIESGGLALALDDGSKLLLTEQILYSSLIVITGD